MLAQGHAAELREGRLEVRKLQGVWPVAGVRSSQNFEYLEDLVNLGITHEQRPSLEHLCEYASRRPQVYAERVVLRRQKNFWASVPKRNDFVCIRFNGEAESSGQAEICQLYNLSVGANE